jgi:hypothetical protein
LKAIADYLTGPGSHISPEMAREAMDSAKRFVERVTGLIPAQEPEQSRDRAPAHAAAVREASPQYIAVSDPPGHEPDRDDEHEPD